MTFCNMTSTVTEAEYSVLSLSLSRSLSLSLTHTIYIKIYILKLLYASSFFIAYGVLLYTIYLVFASIKIFTFL